MKQPRELVAPGAPISLSGTQRQILVMIALGASRTSIVREVGITPHCLKMDIKALMDTFGCDTREHLVAQAFRHRILAWDDTGRIGARREKNG